MRKMVKPTIVVAILLILFGFTLGPVYAALGDVLATINPLYTGNGRAMAFDGVNKLYYTTYPSLNNIYEVKTDGTGSAITTTLSFDVGAMAWDAGRGGLWLGRYDAGGVGNEIWFLTIPGLVLTYKWSITGFTNYQAGMAHFPSFMDGLEYDATTDTLWVSEDWAHRIYHCTPAGVEIGYFDTMYAPGDYWDNSGIAMDHNGHLWLGQPGDCAHQMIPGDQVYKYAQDGTYLGLVFNPATKLGVGSWRPEGIAFDNGVTFIAGPIPAVWINKDGGAAPQIAAFEVPIYEPGVPEFELAMPIMTSIATVLYLGIRRRFRK